MPPDHEEETIPAGINDLGKVEVHALSKEEYEVVCHAKVLRVRAGDVVVARLRHQVSDRERAGVLRIMERIFQDAKVLVVDPDIEIGVLRLELTGGEATDA